MPIIYDLHTHTTASDGEFSPETLVIKAKANRVDVLAVTDHDTTSSFVAATNEASKHNIKLIPGIELSVSWMDRSFHIVGLGIDPDNRRLNKSLKETKELREQRAIKIGGELEKIGVSKAYEEAKMLAGAHTLTRSHFARVLIGQGFAKDTKEVFKKYLVSSKPGFVKTTWLEMEAGIKLLADAGGEAILAHPMRYNISTSGLKKFLTAFKESGGVGIEVVTGSTNAEEITRSAILAKQFELSGSVGSDFHGFDNTRIQLGKLATMPKSVTPIWNHWTI